LVETRNGILRKAKLALRPMTTLASLTGVKGLPCSGSYGCVWHCKKRMKKDKKTLDSADDVIHET
jgi:hypothetical protein